LESFPPLHKKEKKKHPEHSYDIYSSVLEELQRVRRVWKSNSQLPGSQLQFALLGNKITIFAVIKTDETK